MEFIIIFAVILFSVYAERYAESTKTKKRKEQQRESKSALDKYMENTLDFFGEKKTTEPKIKKRLEEYTPSDIQSMAGSDEWYAYKHEYLQSIRWKKLRKVRLALDNYKCYGCGESRPLEIHHITYDDFGNEKMDQLRSLCRDCHQMQHDYYGYFFSGTHNIIRKEICH